MLWQWLSRRASEVWLAWRAVRDDLSDLVGVAWRDPAPPPGGACGGEAGELVLVPADFDVVSGQVAVGCADEGGDVANVVRV